MQGVYIRQVELMRRLVKPGAKVLDWGCGRGHSAYLMRKAGLDVVCCDTSTEPVHPLLREQGFERVTLYDRVALPFPNATFDVVTSFGVLEHVQDDAGSMREIHRVLKPGGLFFVFFLPQRFAWTQHLAKFTGGYAHERLYGAAQLRAMAAKAGLSIVDLWRGQLLPKRSVRGLPAAAINVLERLDRLLTDFTPLKHIATNIEAVLVKQ